MRRLLTIALALMLMSGCALIRQIGDMTPKQKAVWMMSTFNGQIQSLRMQAIHYWDERTSEEARLIMRWKMTLLRKVYPMIKAYAEAAARGEDPGASTETVIIEIINQVLDAAACDVPPGADLVDPPPKPARPLTATA
jgi:hypothetical protein